jgi:hypothetical protein
MKNLGQMIKMWSAIMTQGKGHEHRTRSLTQLQGRT